MKKYSEKELYAAQGLSLPNHPHDFAGRDVSISLTPAEVECWRETQSDWQGLVESSREFFGEGKKLFFVSSRYGINAPLKFKEV